MGYSNNQSSELRSEKRTGKQKNDKSDNIHIQYSIDFYPPAHAWSGYLKPSDQQLLYKVIFVSQHWEILSCFVSDWPRPSPDTVVFMFWFCNFLPSVSVGPFNVIQVETGEVTSVPRYIIDHWSTPHWPGRRPTSGLCSACRTVSKS